MAMNITPRTWVQVEVLLPGVKWNSKLYSAGETFTAEFYQVEPAIRIGQVKLVAVLDGPPAPAMPEIIPGPAPDGI